MMAAKLLLTGLVPFLNYSVMSVQVLDVPPTTRSEPASDSIIAPPKHGLYPKEFQDDLEDLGVDLLPSRFQPRTTGLGNRKPMMWVHIHKAAGSLICYSAGVNGERVVQPSGNCNWSGHDGGAGALYKERTNCSERHAHFAEHNYTWGQIERVLADEFCFDDFEYGVWLRDPMTLANSEAVFRSYTEQEINDSIDFARNEKRRPWQRDAMPLWMYFDNYVVRILGGPEVWNLPPGQIGMNEFNKAKMLLDRFAVKVAMEDVLAGGRAQDKFVKTTRWGQVPFKVVNPSAGSVTFTKEQEKLIRESNKYDYLLYSFVSGASP